MSEVLSCAACGTTSADPAAFHRVEVGDRQLRLCSLACVLDWAAARPAEDLEPMRVLSNIHHDR